MASEHICEVCFQPVSAHYEADRYPPPCCFGCPCGVTQPDPNEDPDGE